MRHSIVLAIAVLSATSITRLYAAENYAREIRDALKPGDGIEREVRSL